MKSILIKKTHTHLKGIRSLKQSNTAKNVVVYHGRSTVLRFAVYKSVGCGLRMYILSFTKHSHSLTEGVKSEADWACTTSTYGNLSVSVLNISRPWHVHTFTYL
jgi:hypothetical protein